jgi:hypothetical protein
MYYIIHTQHLENYGLFDEPAKPRWKAKGGDIYVIYNASPNDRTLNNFIAEECVKSSPGFCTYPIGKIIDVPSHNSNVYRWVAEEVDYPWFKFVYVTAPDKWEIQSVELDQEMWFSDDEGYAKVVLAAKIKELTWQDKQN